MNYDQEFLVMRTVQFALLTAQPVQERRVKKSYKIFKKIRHENTDPNDCIRFDNKVYSDALQKEKMESSSN